LYALIFVTNMAKMKLFDIHSFSFFLLFLWNIHLFAQDDKKALQTINLPENVKHIEVQHKSKQGKDIPCTIGFWEGDYILIECKVSASNSESLNYLMKKENPFEIQTEEQKKKMILKITGTNRELIVEGEQIKFDVEYDMLIPENIKVFNEELISK